MIYESDLIFLIQQWEGRKKQGQDPSYVDALNDCIYELNNLITLHHDREIAEHELADEIFKEYTSEEINYALQHHVA